MIRFKLIIRNVFSKPLRTIIIILSLAAAAFAALFCISGINSAKNGIYAFFRSNYGEANIMMASNDNIEVKQEDLPAGSKMVGQAAAQVALTSQNTKYINYVTLTKVNVIGMDTQKAYDMKIFDLPYSTEDGITMTRTLAAQLGLKVGDTFKFFGYKGKEYNMKILDLANPDKILKSSPLSIITTPELCCEIGGYAEGNITMMYIDVPDDQVDSTIYSLRSQHPGYFVIGTASGDNDDTMMNMLNVYYLIFAVVFLMVAFIVVSLSKHIVNERMSVIGMLRSIGGSIRGTGMLLLGESAFYGLCGGIVGVLLFIPFRGKTDMGMFAPPDVPSSLISDGINFGTICLVILAVILIQCIFSLAAILKAAKTPVRDIIFGTKETAYIPSNILTGFGVVLLTAGIIVFLCSDSFLFTVISAFCSVIGAVLIFPWLIKLISNALGKLLRRYNKPVACLAVKEIATTKSSISSSQLILSAMSLTIAVLVIAVSLLKLLSFPFFQSELMIVSPSQQGPQYDYLEENAEGVTDIEKIYCQYLLYERREKLNGDERDLVVMGYEDGGFKYFIGITDCPEKLAADEAAVDKVLANKLGLKIGDSFTLELNTRKYYPRELKLKVAAFVDAGYFNNLGNTILLNLDTYKSVYFDEPNYVLIKTEPGKEFSVYTTLQSTLPDTPSSLRITSDYLAEYASSMSSLLSIVYAVIILGLALSLLGTTSNILMGFEQSRRKYAVFYSTSMSKAKLKKLILLETVFTCGISITASILFGLYFLQIISKALSMLNMSVPLVPPFGYAVLFGVCVFIILLVSVIKPIRALAHMNMAEEIKTAAD